MKWYPSSLIFISILYIGCNQNQPSQSTSTEISDELWVKMLVEIPAGTIEKYELNKTTGQLVMDSVEGKARRIEYLGYPANYGMIPNTLLAKNKGGDGDPLDIIAIGPPESSGSLIDCKVIGVLKLKDRGEQDDKLIAITKNSTLQGVNSIQDLEQKYPGITLILETWFTNYKGQGKMISQGFQNKTKAVQIYSAALVKEK